MAATVASEVLQGLRNGQEVDIDSVIQSIRQDRETREPRNPSPQPPPPTANPAENIQAWLAPLLEKLTAEKPSSKRPSMKTPEAFTGKDISKFRAWWRTVRDYMEVNEPFMPKDKVKISWIGSLLKSEAQCWFQTRQTRLETYHLIDTWTEFQEAFIKRFTDELQLRKDSEAMVALKYEGSIDDYFARLEDYNSRVGPSGPLYRTTILHAMSDEIHDMVFNHSGRFPEEDNALVNVIRDAGRALEEKKRFKELNKAGKNNGKNKKDK